jgi:hypothetical protein
VALPGLPGNERMKASDASSLVELRLDFPNGPLIGTLRQGGKSCPVTNATGIRSLFLVFPGNPVRSVDWFRFE